MALRQFDAGYESAGRLDETTPLIEPGEYAPPTERSTVALPAPARLTVTPPGPKSVVVRKPVVKPKPAAAPRTVAAPKPAVKRVVPKTVTAPKPTYRRVLTGLASWYDNGTTAMRLPRGTHIRICGARSCVTTVVRDWGPASYLSKRVVDMTPGDFVRVTGKSLGAGLAPVTVYIY